MKKKYGFHYRGHFELPFGICYSDIDDGLNLYYQEGLFPDESVTPVRKKNLLSLQEDTIPVKTSGIQYLRWQKEALYATNSRALIRFDQAAKESRTIGKAGTGKDEYILPADFILFKGDIFLSDLNSNKIIRYDHEDRIKEIYSLEPYACPLAMKMIDEDTLVLALRSEPWSGIKRMLSEEFHHLPETHNTQKDNLIVLNLKTRQVEPFSKCYDMSRINKAPTEEISIGDMEIDFPYLYFLTGYYQNFYLIKYDIAAQEMIFDYNISRNFREGTLNGLTNLRNIELLRIYSIKRIKIKDEVFLLFYVNFLNKSDSSQYKTLCLKFRIN